MSVRCRFPERHTKSVDLTNVQLEANSLARLPQAVRLSSGANSLMNTKEVEIACQKMENNITNCTRQPQTRCHTMPCALPNTACVWHFLSFKLFFSNTMVHYGKKSFASFSPKCKQKKSDESRESCCSEKKSSELKCKKKILIVVFAKPNPNFGNFEFFPTDGIRLAGRHQARPFKFGGFRFARSLGVLFKRLFCFWLEGTKVSAGFPPKTNELKLLTGQFSLLIFCCCQTARTTTQMQVALMLPTVGRPNYFSKTATMFWSRRRGI